MTLTRRSFLSTAVGLAAADVSLTATPAEGAAFQPGAPSGRLTATQIVDRIKAHVGIPWRTETVDRIVAGDPDTVVSGVATTMMATLDVLQRAAAAGRNFVITHESTYFSHQDRIDSIAEDPTYQFKRDFIARHGMAVFHFHDHWHGRTPDGIAVGMMRALGWQQHADPENPKRFTFPPTTLGTLAKDIESRLGIRTMRFVGDRNTEVRRVLASWGFVSLTPGLPLLARPDVDVLVVGETHEWELVEYVQDQIASGLKKGLVVLGHVVSEQPGMHYCAEWLKDFVTEVPVEFIPAPEPFWRP